MNNMPETATHQENFTLPDDYIHLSDLTFTQSTVQIRKTSDGRLKIDDFTQANKLNNKKPTKTLSPQSQFFSDWDSLAAYLEKNTNVDIWKIIDITDIPQKVYYYENVPNTIADKKTNLSQILTELSKSFTYDDEQSLQKHLLNLINPYSAFAVKDLSRISDGKENGEEYLTRYYGAKQHYPLGEFNVPYLNIKLGPRTTSIEPLSNQKEFFHHINYQPLENNPLPKLLLIANSLSFSFVIPSNRAQTSPRINESFQHSNDFFDPGHFSNQVNTYSNSFSSNVINTITMATLSRYALGNQVSSSSTIAGLATLLMNMPSPSMALNGYTLTNSFVVNTEGGMHIDPTIVKAGDHFAWAWRGKDFVDNQTMTSITKYIPMIRPFDSNLMPLSNQVLMISDLAGTTKDLGFISAIGYPDRTVSLVFSSDRDLDQNREIDTRHFALNTTITNVDYQLIINTDYDYEQNPYISQTSIDGENIVCLEYLENSNDWDIMLLKLSYDLTAVLQERGVSFNPAGGNEYTLPVNPACIQLGNYALVLYQGTERAQSNPNYIWLNGFVNTAGQAFNENKRDILVNDCAGQGCRYPNAIDVKDPIALIAGFKGVNTTDLWVLPFNNTDDTFGMEKVVASNCLANSRPILKKLDNSTLGMLFLQNITNEIRAAFSTIDITNFNPNNYTIGPIEYIGNNSLGVIEHPSFEVDIDRLIFTMNAVISNGTSTSNVYAFEYTITPPTTTTVTTVTTVPPSTSTTSSSIPGSTSNGQSSSTSTSGAPNNSTTSNSSTPSNTSTLPEQIPISDIEEQEPNSNLLMIILSISIPLYCSIMIGSIAACKARRKKPHQHENTLESSRAVNHQANSSERQRDTEMQTLASGAITSSNHYGQAPTMAAFKQSNAYDQVHVDNNTYESISRPLAGQTSEVNKLANLYATTGTLMGGNISENRPKQAGNDLNKPSEVDIYSSNFLLSNGPSTTAASPAQDTVTSLPAARSDETEHELKRESKQIKSRRSSQKLEALIDNSIYTRPDPTEHSGPGNRSRRHSRGSQRHSRRVSLTRHSGNHGFPLETIDSIPHRSRRVSVTQHGGNLDAPLQATADEPRKSRRTSVSRRSGQQSPQTSYQDNSYQQVPRNQPAAYGDTSLYKKAPEKPESPSMSNP